MIALKSEAAFPKEQPDAPSFSLPTFLKVFFFVLFFLFFLFFTVVQTVNLVRGGGFGHSRGRSARIVNPPRHPGFMYCKSGVEHASLIKHHHEGH